MTRPVLRVGDPGGFPVGRGGGRPPGVFLAQRGGCSRGQHAELPGQPWLGAGGHLLAEGAGPVVQRGGQLVGNGGGPGGCPAGAQVTSCPASCGRASFRRRSCRTLAIDRAPSIGAAVIWSISAAMSCP